jgi:ABC-type multidrug transport system ATPase subunit
MIQTTLLNVLARRIKSNLTGEVLVNGEEVRGRRFKRRMAYVLQDDIFFPSISVRDTVTDAAYLKLPKSMSWKEKRSKVEDVLSELGLQRCSNTIVGDGWVVRYPPIHGKQLELGPVRVPIPILSYSCAEGSVGR